MRLKILLTDDDADDRELFQEAVFQIDGEITCDVFADGIQMLDKLTQENYLPDVIFLDINMPLMSGWECIAAIKSQPTTNNIPVIMYSTSSHERDKELAQEAGAVGLIIKPVDFVELKAMLEKVIRQLKGDQDLSSLFKGANGL
jgi:CheY-like chemotaxis protein